MKKCLILFLFLSTLPAFSQVKGISYQAVILITPEHPGADNQAAALSEQNVCLKFKFNDANGTNEYEEIIFTQTDLYGMINVVIGTGERIGGSSASFGEIKWNSDSKFLDVSLDKGGLGTDFKALSKQEFTAVPFALFAANSGNNTTGIQGEIGVKGDAGEVGLTGLQGAVGIAGNQGIQGITGDTGMQGTSGAKGDAGNVGLTGLQGAVGVAGNQGIQGITGDPGMQGTSGTKGDAGEVGLTGMQGAVGVAGNQGIQGITGDPGIQGTSGAKGDAGNVGLTGLQGAVGVAGNQGIQGITGDPGIQGASGAKGDAGNVGLTGLQGAIGVAGNQGIQGVKGEIGTQGASGAKGDTGDLGLTGLQGAVGIAGNQGIQGVKGEIGTQGTPGTKGDTGNLGLTGLQGAVGIAGNQGITGETGTQGLAGAKGDTGDLGLTGSQGAIGVAGNQGIQGVQGEVGTQGASGAKGDTGDLGLTGLQGAVGIAGNQGIQGVQGDVGTQGLAGAKGDTGDRGLLGLQGPVGTAGNQGIQGVQGPSGIAASSASFVDLSTDQTVEGNKTFARPISADISGNAATTTTNADLTGAVISVGNATSLADGAVTNPKLDKANIPLSGFGLAVADVDLGANKLTGMADPVDAQDAATKNYVDNALVINSITESDIIMTTSTQDLLVPGMTVSLGLGTYLVLFNGQISSDQSFTSNKGDQDVRSLYTALMAEVVTFPSHSAAFVNETLVPGVYNIASAISIAGTITLDGQNLPNPLFIIRSTGAMTAGTNTNIVLINGATAKNVFWVAQGAISTTDPTSMKGILITNSAAVSLGANTSLEGRMFAVIGAVSMGAGSTLTIPAGVSQFDLGVLSSFAMYTGDGAV